MSRSLLVAGVAAAALHGAHAKSSDVWPPSAYAAARAMLAKMTLQDKLQMAAGTGKTYPYVGIVPGNSRQGIPSMGLEDGPQGVADGATLVTAWPSALTVVTTWDNSLMFEFGRAMAEEQFSKGSSVMLVSYGKGRKGRTRRGRTAGRDDRGASGSLQQAALRALTHSLWPLPAALSPSFPASPAQGPGVNLARVPWGGRNFEYQVRGLRCGGMGAYRVPVNNATMVSPARAAPSLAALITTHRSRLPLPARHILSSLLSLSAQGEDPVLAGEMVAAEVSGIQSVPGILACVKHFVGNNQEFNRNTVSANVGERALRELYYAPFAAAVDAGVGSAMCSYNR